MQLIKRKSIAKVDKDLLALAVLYIAVIVVYAIFEFVIVNYRPIIMPGSQYPEASFPSSHTMLVCVLMGSTIMLIGRYLKKKNMSTIIRIICAVIIVLTVIGRLICGVHWCTDIIGGVLISITLLSLFSIFRKDLKN